MSKDVIDAILIILTGVLIGLTLRIINFTKLQLQLLGKTDELIQLLKPVLSARAILVLTFGELQSKAKTFDLNMLDNTTTLLITIRNDGEQIANHIMVELHFMSMTFSNFRTAFKVSESLDNDNRLVQILVPRILHPAQKITIAVKCDISNSYDGSVERINAGLFWTDFQPRALSYTLAVTARKQIHENT